MYKPFMPEEPEPDKESVGQPDHMMMENHEMMPMDMIPMQMMPPMDGA